MATLRICDERLPGAGATEQLELSGLPDVITVEELIRWRVREEVARYNATHGAGKSPPGWWRSPPGKVSSTVLDAGYQTTSP